MARGLGSRRLRGALRAVTGFFRYGLARFDRGRLRVGDRAPDAVVFDLNGEPLNLLSRLRGGPLVLVFGSFT